MQWLHHRMTLCCFAVKFESDIADAKLNPEWDHLMTPEWVLWSLDQRDKLEKMLDRRPTGPLSALDLAIFGDAKLYGFRTRDGHVGVLQITGFTRNPQGVKIRYKLVEGITSTVIVQGEAMAAPSPERAAGGTNSQEDALARLREQGALVEMDEQQPGTVTAVVLVGKSATDAALADVEQFTDLAELSVCGQGVTDAGLAHLNKLHHLHRLDLQYTRITDAGLDCLRGLAALKELNLDGSFRITDAGLRQLKTLSALQSLNLTFTQGTDQGITDLQRAIPQVNIHRRYHVLQTGGALDDKAALSGNERVDRLRRQMLHAIAEKPGKPADWTTLAEALDETLQASPEQIGAWERLAWNLSYNVAEEFKDVRDRYWWAKQGICVLLAGADKNPNSGRFAWNVGWFTGQRIGHADDAVQLRRLFADDTKLDAALLAGFRREDTLGPLGRLDNWLVARQWFIRAEPLLAKEFGKGQDIKSPLIFYSSAPMCQISYAMAVENDGVFGNATKEAWAAAADQWRDYGNDDIPTTFKDETTGKPIIVRLNDEEMHSAAAQKLVAQLDAIQPELRGQLIAEKRACVDQGSARGAQYPCKRTKGQAVSIGCRGRSCRSRDQQRNS